MQEGTLTDSQYDIILKSVIYVLCKPMQGIKSICIKPYVLCTVMMKDITRLMPHTRQLFIYRNSLNTINSWLSIMQCEPFLEVMTSCANADWFSMLCPYFRNLERYNFVSILKDFKQKQIPTDANTACVFAYMWSLCMLIARDAMSHDPSILPVKYEDIIARPKEILKQLFDNLDIDIIHLDNAVISMERDSQRKSIVSRDRLATSKFISTADKIKIDIILYKFNLTLLDKKFRI